MPILQEAFVLHMKMVRKKEEAEREIKRVEKNKKKLREEAKNYNKYKKAQV